MLRKPGRRWPLWLGAAALLLLVAGLVVGYGRDAGPADPRAPGTAEDIAKLAERDDLNLLFVLIDTLRADRLSGYGYPRGTSPVLDQLAAGGVRFARQLAQSSWTKCSMASLWTGLNPARTGVTRFEHALPEEALMPAEILREAGFRTAGIYRNGWVEGYFGFGQGFDVYTRPAASPLPATVKRENPTLKDQGSDMNAVRSAKEFLRVRGDERWFLYLHFMDVHEYLYDESTAVFGSSYSDVYDNSILRENLVLGQLLDHLAEEGHLANTLVAVASDHGEAFGERGFEGHARQVYRESTEVPFILSFPFRLEPGAVVYERTRNIDIWPTLLDLLGLPVPEGLDGRSRVPEILEAARRDYEPGDAGPAFAHLDQSWGQRVRTESPTVAVSQDGFRYVMVRKPNGETEREELFHWRKDPREERDVLTERPEVAARLRALAADYLDSRPPWEGGAPVLEIDEMQLNQLRALGYALP